MAVMAMCVLLSCTEKKEEATLSGLMKSNFVSEVQGKPTALYVCMVVWKVIIRLFGMPNR